MRHEGEDRHTVADAEEEEIDDFEDGGDGQGAGGDDYGAVVEDGCCDEEGYCVSQSEGYARINCARYSGLVSFGGGKGVFALEVGFESQGTHDSDVGKGFSEDVPSLCSQDVAFLLPFTADVREESGCGPNHWYAAQRNERQLPGDQECPHD